MASTSIHTGVTVTWAECWNRKQINTQYQEHEKTLITEIIVLQLELSLE